MRVLICGSRGWQDKQPIRDVIATLAKLPGEHTIVHGDARGADRIASSIAPNYGIRVEAHPAAWELHRRPNGKNPAGAIRNREMIATGIDCVYAFRSAGVSRGTDDMIAVARAAGVPVYITERDGLQPRRKA